MSENTKNTLAVVREYSREICMLSGFALAWLIYTDHREFCSDAAKELQSISEILRDLKAFHAAEKKD